MNNPVLLDIMVNGSYYCQLKYDKHGLPELIDGKIEEVYDTEELKEYIENLGFNTSCCHWMFGEDMEITFHKEVLK